MLLKCKCVLFTDGVGKETKSLENIASQYKSYLLSLTSPVSQMSWGQKTILESKNKQFNIPNDLVFTSTFSISYTKLAAHQCAGLLLNAVWNLQWPRRIVLVSYGWCYVLDTKHFACKAAGVDVNRWLTEGRILKWPDDDDSHYCRVREMFHFSVNSDFVSYIYT